MANCLTVTGKSLAENLAQVDSLPEDKRYYRPLSNPLNQQGICRY